MSYLLNYKINNKRYNSKGTTQNARPPRISKFDDSFPVPIDSKPMSVLEFELEKKKYNSGQYLLHKKSNSKRESNDEHILIFNFDDM